MLLRCCELQRVLLQLQYSSFQKWHVGEMYQAVRPQDMFRLRVRQRAYTI